MFLSAQLRRESSLFLPEFLKPKERSAERRKILDEEGKGREAVRSEKRWGTVKEKAGYTAPPEVEEKAAQQHLLLQLNVSEVTSTKRMPPEGGENKQSVRTSWQLEKNNLTIKQHHWEHWTAAPASSSSLFKACQKNNKRCYKEKTNLRQSGQRWNWPEGIAVRTGFLKLCEHLGACRGG